MGKRHDHRRGGLVGPVILISLGIIFLLNNLGLLSWSIWETLLRLWPILLVAAGLDLILGQRSAWGSLLALALTLAILGAALWLSGTGAEWQRTARSEEIAQAIGGVSEAKLVIAPGVGTLSIKAVSDSANLVQGSVVLRSRERLQPRFTVDDGTGTFVLDTQATSFGPTVVGLGGQRSWDLQLSPDVPLHLETDLSVGEQNLDLTGLALNGLDVEQGIGQATITLPEGGRFEARIEGAIGQTIVVIPEVLAARVLLDTGLSGRRLPPEYRCEEDVCTSPGYETADHRVDLRLRQAIGNVVIRH